MRRLSTAFPPASCQGLRGAYHPRTLLAQSICKARQRKLSHALCRDTECIRDSVPSLTPSLSRFSYLSFGAEVACRGGKASPWRSNTSRECVHPTSKPRGPLPSASQESPRKTRFSAGRHKEQPEHLCVEERFRQKSFHCLRSIQLQRMKRSEDHSGWQLTHHALTFTTIAIAVVAPACLSFTQPGRDSH